MSFLPREAIEGVWFDLEKTKDINSIPFVFKNGWSWVLVDPLYLFDEKSAWLA